jgi:hypothetical protein
LGETQQIRLTVPIQVNCPIGKDTSYRNGCLKRPISIAEKNSVPNVHIGLAIAAKISNRHH